jgi:DNA-binding SARP family transcriptional activator
VDIRTAASRGRAGGQRQCGAGKILAHALQGESRGHWAKASGLYQRAIEIDLLAETHYRRQMLCLQAQGQRAGAVEGYRLCRHTLSVVLGVSPTVETERVYQQLLVGESRAIRLAAGNFASVGDPWARAIQTH